LSGFQDARLLDHAREIRDRLLIDGTAQVLSAAGFVGGCGRSDGEETWHSAIKALRAAAGKSSYRLGLEQHCPLPIASVENPAATRMLDIERGADKTMATA
jgi:hypothetical protein